MKPKNLTSKISGIQTDPTADPNAGMPSSPVNDAMVGSQGPPPSLADTAHGGFSRPGGDSVHLHPFENLEPDFNTPGVGHKTMAPGDYNAKGKVSIAGRQLPAASKKVAKKVPMSKGKMGKPTTTRKK